MPQHWENDVQRTVWEAQSTNSWHMQALDVLSDRYCAEGKH